MTEDYVSPNPDPEYWRRHINGMILDDYKGLIGGQVVEVGCNHGALAAVMAGYPTVDHVFGIDVSPKALSAASILRGNQPPHIQEKLSFHLEDFSKPLREIYWADVVVAFHVLEHISTQDIPGFVHNLWGIMGHSNCVLIVSVPFMNAYPSDYHHQQFTIQSITETLSPRFRPNLVLRDQRTDGHGNSHDCLTYVGQPI